MSSIEANGISKNFGTKQALRGVSFTVSEGVTGLLGPNGAGKTTLLNILSTLQAPTSGEAWVAGHLTTANRQAVRAAIGYLPQTFGLYDSLSGNELLNYFADLKRVDAGRHWIEQVVELVGLQNEIHKRVGAMSGGMRQRLGIAQALIGRPSVLLVDEPTAGLDPEERTRFRNLLIEIGNRCAVLLSTHIVEDIEYSANKVIVLDAGQVRFDGPTVELRNRALRKAWAKIIDRASLEDFRTQHVISRLSFEEDYVEVRWLETDTVVTDAKPVRPTLEEGYLLTINPAS